MSRRRRIIMTLFCFSIAAMLVWASHPFLIRAMGRWLDVGGPPQRADYIMLLNGGETSRPFAAAALVKARWAPKVLLAHVAPTPAVEDLIFPSYEQINRDVLIKRGVPAENIIILPDLSVGTCDEAQALATFLKDRPTAKVLVLTDNYHTRRSRWVFERFLAGQARQIAFISSDNEDINLDQWWKDERAFVAIISEYLKMAFYFVCYGYFGQWLIACALFTLVARGVRYRKFDFLTHPK